MNKAQKRKWIDQHHFLHWMAANISLYRTKTEAMHAYRKQTDDRQVRALRTYQDWYNELLVSTK